MRIRRYAGGAKGMTLVEILVGITIFAIGVLSLTHVMFAAMHANVRSKHVVVATNLAHQRMEQILSVTRYNQITATNYPDEDYGAIQNGAEEYSGFRRTVAIADSLNALNASIMKEVTVRVEWRERGITRNVELHSSITKFKDIQL